MAKFEREIGYRREVLKYSTEWNPFEMEYDAIAFGGGLCGLSAALALKRVGKTVLVVERRSALGREIGCSFQTQLPEGDAELTVELRRRLEHYHAVQGEEIDLARAELVLDLICEDEGIDVLLYSLPVDVKIDEGRVAGIIIGNKSGEQTLRAKAYIDATENALLWKLAGASFRPVDSRPCRQVFFFNNVPEGFVLPDEVGDAAGEARDIILRKGIWKGEVSVSFTMPSYSIGEARLAQRDVLVHLKKTIPELEEAGISHAAFEPYPLEAESVLEKDPWEGSPCCNLFACGIWGEIDDGQRADLIEIGGRIQCGQRVGEKIAGLELPSVPATTNTVSDIRKARTIEADVVVAGAGTGGSVAAIAAARQGAKVVVIEACTGIGGMVTLGGMHQGGHGVPGGLQDEVNDMVLKDRKLFAGKLKMPPINPIIKTVIFERIYKELGIEIIYGATITGAIKAGSRITAARAATPDGPVVVEADAFVDSTGDADLAIMAGAPFRTGREIDQVLHCYTLCGECYDEKTGKVGTSNFDCGYTDPYDVVDLTRGKRLGLRQHHDLLKDHLRILYAFPVLGLRQGRQIIGECTPTMHDQIFHKHFDDCIGYSAAKYDCHSKDFANHNDFAVFFVWILGNRERHIGGELPYRCMLPKDVDGVLVACRSASCSNEANYEQRVIRNCRRMGEAAGIAAALCSRLGKTPRMLDVSLVQNELFKTGALGDEVRPTPPVPDYSREKQKKILLSKKPQDAVWLLAHGGPEAAEILHEVLESGEFEGLKTADGYGPKVWAAVALAWRRDPAAVPVLIEVIENRPKEDDDYVLKRRFAPFWMTMIVMLGRLGDPRAIPVLVDLLDEPRWNSIDIMLACVRALGRIGDPKAVPVLEGLLEREELPNDRYFQLTNPNLTAPPGEDGTWQIELAIADVLSDFGRPQPLVVERHRHERRPWVRRYARMLEAKNDAVFENRKLVVPLEDRAFLRA